MPLDDLVNVIETLQQRIKDHGDSLRQNETRTRMALIDPLLQALGWDVADPGVVTPEFNVGNGRADYALLGTAGKPTALVEAKHLEEQLESSGHQEQVFTYALMQQVKYAGLTNGNRWVLDDVSGERRKLDVTIANLPAHQCALKFPLLWRPNLASGAPVAGSEPIVSSDSQTIPVVDIRRPVALPSETSREDGWTSLAELQSVTGRPAPSAIKFPNGVEKEVNRWWNLLFEVAEWQIGAGTLTFDKCPIRQGRTKYIVNTNAQHSNGTAFNQSRQLSNGLFLDTPYDANGLLNGAKLLCTYFGENPASVHLKLG